MLPATKLTERFERLDSLLRSPTVFEIQRMIRDSESELSSVSSELAADIHNFLGVANGRIGRYQKALYHGRIAARLQPGNKTHKQSLGIFELGLGSNSAALEHLIEASEALPDDYVILANLAEAFAKAGDPETARDALAEAIRIAEANPRSTEFFGRFERNPAERLLFFACLAADCGFAADALILLHRCMKMEYGDRVPESPLTLVREHPQLLPWALWELAPSRTLGEIVNRVQRMSPEVARMQLVAFSQPVGEPFAKHAEVHAETLEWVRPLFDRAHEEVVSEADG